MQWFITLLTSITRRKVLWCILYAAAPALVFYWLSLEILTQQGFTFREILRDPAQQTGASSFIGFVSNIGVWLWVSSAAICIFAALTQGTTKNRNHTELLILMGGLSLLLAIDDFFLLHERYVYQKGIFFFYAVFAITLMIRHYRTISAIDTFPFLLAGILLGSSVEIDINQRKIPFDYIHVQIVEEACKFVGAAVWLYFCGRVATWGQQE